MAAQARGLVHEWLDDLEEAGSGLVRICGRRRIEQAFSRFLKGERSQSALQRLLTACSQHDLDGAARLLEARAAALTPTAGGDSCLQTEVLAFAAGLRALLPPPAEAEEHLDQPHMRPTEVLWHTAAALRAAKTAAAAGRAMAEGAVALCEAPRAVWWRREERALQAEVVAGLPLALEGLSFRPTSAFWTMKPTREALVELSPDQPEQAELLVRLQAQRGVIVRLRDGQRWNGALSVQDGVFDAERLDLLAAIAQQGAATLRALELEQAWEQVEHTKRETREDVGFALTSAAGLEELLTRVCGLAAAAAGADACFVFLTDDLDRLLSGARLGADQEEARHLEPELEALVASVSGGAAGEALVLEEDRLRELEATRVLAAGFRSALVLGIATRTQSLGALVLLAREPGAFGARARREVAALAVQATSAIENMLLYENAQRRLTEMSDLTWVSGRIASTLDPDTIAQTIARAAADVASVARVAVFLADEEGEFYPLTKGQFGFLGAKTARLPGVGHIGAEALALQATRAIGDVEREHREDDVLVEWMGAKSLLCAPMIAPQGLRGIFVVADDAPRVFSLHMVTLLSTYANQAALAFQSATLYQNALQHVRRLSRLGELAEALAAATDPNQTADLTLRAATELLDAPVGLMWLVESPDNDLVLKAVHGLWPGEWAMQRLKPGEGLAGLAAQSGRPLVSVDVTRDGRFMYRRQARQKGLGAAIAAPLISRGQTVGVLNLYRKSPSQFSEEDRRLLMSLASTAAVSIENANLAKEAQLRTEFVTAMMTEVNHRMRNSLQSVAGLLRMELERPQARSAEEVVRRAISRVQAVAAVHEVMREQDVPFVDMKEAAGRVVRVTRLFPDPSIDIHITGTRVMLPSQKAISVALILNELTDNALRHGLAGRPNGRVAISLAEVGGEVVLQVHDNGSGVAEMSGLEESKGLGLQIVRGLVEQELGGSVEFESRNGFTVRARFPKLE